MKKLLNLLVLTLAVLSCERQKLELNDSSFRFRPQVSCDEKTLEYDLYLTLLSGARTGEYEVNYTIDDNPALKLLNSQGESIGSGFKVSFSESVTLRLRLPKLTTGSHRIEVSLASEEYTLQEECTFEVNIVPFSIHAEVNSGSSNPCSVLLLSLQEGLKDRTYRLSLKLDGTEIETDNSVIDFSDTPIYSVALPLVRPGSHSLSVCLTDSFSVQSTTLDFTEPIRFPTLDLTLAYNPKSGNHELTISRNPYGINVKAQSKLVITGHVNFYAACSNGWTYSDPWTYRTSKDMTAEDEQTVETRKDGVFCIAERDRVANDITSSYVFSAIYMSAGSSEDFYYRVSGYEPAYYKISNEELSISFDIEDVPGIRPVLHNGIQGCTVSGIE